MSYIYGIVQPPKSQVEESSLNRMHASLMHDRVDKAGQLIRENAGFGNLLLFNTPESHQEGLPLSDEIAGLTLVADARLDNREELARSLRLSTEEPDGVYLLSAYKKWESDCLEHLEGDFVFAVWDRSKQQLFLARDKMGARGLFYHVGKEQFAFASSVKSLLQLSEIERKLSEEWLTSFLLHQYPTQGETSYEGIFQLPKAHYALLDEKGFRLVRYFEFDRYAELKLSSDEEYLEAFSEQLHRAVKVRLRSNYEIGAELSGGLDSSGVVALAQQFLGEKTLTTFSNVLNKEDYGRIPDLTDERKDIDRVIAHVGINSSHDLSTTDRDQLQLMQDYVDWYGVVPISSENYGWGMIRQFEIASSKNIRTILSGHGGDEIVTSQGGGYGPELLKSFQLAKYLKLEKQRAEIRKMPLGRFLKNALYRDLMPDWAKKRKRKGWTDRNGKGHLAYVQPDWVQKLQLPERRNAGYEGMPTVRSRQIERVEGFGHLDGRMAASAFFASRYGVEYRYPLLDARLAEFYFSLPLDQKINQGWGRWIYRKSMEGTLPPEIQWRMDKHGRIRPSSDILRVNNAERFDEFLQLEGQNPLGLFDLEKLRTESANLLADKKVTPMFIRHIEFYYWLCLLEKGL